jgi:hypothetical protein
MSSAALMLIAASALAGSEQPTVVLHAGRVCVVNLPPVLEETAVAAQLNSGLTTTFALELKIDGAARGRLAGLGQVELRYELWDEKYLLAVTDLEHAANRHEAASLDALLTWWRQLSLCPVATDELPRERPWRATVTLTVLPFSRAEQEDTRAWFSRTLRRSASSTSTSSAKGASSTKTAPVPDDSALRSLSSALIATSIGRSSLITFSWRTTVLQEGPR